MLLSTSILEHVNTEAASELTGNEQAGAILPAVARANAFVQPTGCGWYRYHTLFAEVLRLKLRREYPDRIAALHRRAARWYERNGMLTAAVQHATQAGDWQLAATMVIDALAISEIIEPRGSPSLAGEFRRMPRGEAWAGPQPYLVAAAIELAAGRYDSSAAALDVGEGMLAPLPADEDGRVPACRRGHPRHYLPPHRGPRGGGGGRFGCGGAGQPDAGGQARPAPGSQGAGAGRPRGRRAVAGPSRRGGPLPRCGCGRRDRSGRRARTGRLPRASRAGGGLARPAAPCRKAGRPGRSGLGRRRAAAASSATGPRGACRARLGAPGTG